MPKFTPPIAPQLADPDAERAVREIRTKLVEIQRAPFVGGAIIKSVTLADGVPTPVPHRLGRTYTLFLHSPPRGPSAAGMIEDARSSSFDPAQYIVLKATGYGASVDVDVVVI